MSPRGGARNGTPGKAYPNRSDLTPTAAPGQTYGQAGAQLRAQQAMPMGAQPGPSGPPPAPSAGPPVAPGSLGAFDGPTQRPNEPVTAGADAGPGPGSEILGLPNPNAAPRDPVGASIAELYHSLISLQDKPSLVEAQFARMLRLGFEEQA